MLRNLSLFLHVISDVIWIGGMFLAYVCVRPAAGQALEGPQRLRLWTGIFSRFFPWVWAAVILIIGSGTVLIAQMGAVPPYVLTMTVIGALMSAIFLHIYFAPFGRLKRAVEAEDWKAGAAALDQIRKFVAVNLTLGLINVAVAVLGRG